MARARNIKPGFFTNDKLAEISPLGRLLFAGLWTICDRAGRLEDRPKRIKAELLPYDECDANALLDDLQAKGFIVRYSHGGAEFIQVLNFGKHQNPHMREPESTIPEPGKHCASTMQEPDKNGTGPADSPIPITESIKTICAQPDGFARFWAVYPKKKSKGQAEKAFAKVKPNEQLVSAMLAAVERAKTSDDWRKDEGQFIPHPATWLNAKGWLDDEKSDWWTAAGFATPFEASNAGCSDKTACLWKAGQRVEEPA